MTPLWSSTSPRSRTDCILYNIQWCGDDGVPFKSRFRFRLMGRVRGKATWNCRARRKKTPRSVEGARTGGSHGVAPVLLGQSPWGDVNHCFGENTSRLATTYLGPMQPECQNRHAAMPCKLIRETFWRNSSWKLVLGSELLSGVPTRRQDFWTAGLYDLARRRCLILRRSDKAELRKS